MSSALYAVINPVVKLLLGSPLHGVMSNNTMVLEFTGRKSGNTYSTPVSYYQEGDQVHCLTGKDYKWWRNLAGGNEVRLTLRGKSVVGRPSVIADDGPPLRRALHDFLVAVPRDAKFAGVRLDKEGQPNNEDIEKASPSLVSISITLQGSST